MRKVNIEALAGIAILFTCIGIMLVIVPSFLAVLVLGTCAIILFDMYDDGEDNGN